MKRRFAFKIEPRDLWVGVFWDRKPIPAMRQKDKQSGEMEPVIWRHEWHVYVCPLPAILFHWWWERPAEADPHPGRTFTGRIVGQDTLPPLVIED